jgi:hypothetical protein
MPISKKHSAMISSMPEALNPWPFAVLDLDSIRADVVFNSNNSSVHTQVVGQQ